MIPSIKGSIKANKTIVANLSYMSILQILSLSLPFISYPYLIKTLGAKSYGLIIYSQAITGYLSILINFGFNITATKDISIFRNNLVRLNSIVNAVIQIKGILFLLSVAILFFYLYIFDITGTEKQLYVLSLWVCANEFLFPLWYFQGIEKMRYVTIITVASKLVFTILLFLFINDENDILLFPILNGIGVVISNIFSVYLLKKNNITLKFIKPILLIYYVRKSYVMALANASNAFKSSFNIIVIKNVLSYSAVAYFDLALKIINIGITFLDLISQSVFPKMSISKDIKFLKKIILASFLVSTAMVLVIYIFGSYAIKLLGGGEMAGSLTILQILSLNLPLYIVGALLGRNCLIIFGFQKQVLKSMLYSSIFYLGAIALAKLYLPDVSTITISIIFVSSYIFELLYRYKSCKKYKLL